MKSIYLICIILSCLLLAFYFNAQGSTTIIEKRSSLEDRALNDLAIYDISSKEGRKDIYFSNLSTPKNKEKSFTTSLPYTQKSSKSTIRHNVFLAN